MSGADALELLVGDGACALAYALLCLMRDDSHCVGEPSAALVKAAHREQQVSLLKVSPRMHRDSNFSCWCACRIVCPGCAELIEATRLRMRATSGLGEGALVLQSLLGEGTFGKVYTGLWVSSGTFRKARIHTAPVGMVMIALCDAWQHEPAMLVLSCYRLVPLTSM